MLVASIALLVVASGGLGLIELRERRRIARTWCRLKLGFGRDVSVDAVVAILAQLAGMSGGRTVALVTEATRHEIGHYLETDQANVDNLKSTLPALLPSLRLEPVDLDPAPDYQVGRAIRLRGKLNALRGEEPAGPSTALLGAFQPLGEDEALILRWLVGAGRPERLPERRGDRPIPAEERRLLKTKNEGAVVSARGWVAVRAGHPRRALHLLGRVSVVMRGRSGAYGHLVFSPRRGGWLRRGLSARRLLLADRYGVNELVGLLGWPLDAPRLPGLTLGTAPLLMPSPRLPSGGRVFGRATWPAEQRPIGQPLKGALSHALIAGPTGTGKSTLITHLMRMDVQAGRGLVLIDGKGDTASGLLAHIPRERRDDVVLLDCGAEDARQPGIRLFGGGSPELAADVVLGIFADLFQGSWGPLSERYMRAGLVAIAHDPTGTLADLPFVFTDTPYRRRLVGALRDPLTKATFAAYEAMGESERAHQLAAPLGKLGALLGHPIVRTVLGQPGARLDFREVLARNRIAVVSLAPARVGGPAARLVGALSVFALFQAVLGRGSLPEKARRPFLAYFDEPKALGALPMPLDLLLEQARGLGVGITLAPQAVTQLAPAVVEATLTNAATRIAFRQSADDARLLARDLPGVAAEDLTELGAHEIVARIGLGPGDVAPPVTVKTAPPPKPVNSDEEVERLAAHAAERWGMDLASVDAALEARHAEPKDTPVGRRRRAA